MTVQSIRPEDLARLYVQQGPVELIDVRTQREFEEAHVEFARNIPLDQLDPAAILSAGRNNDWPIYVICRSGGRGQKACEKFHAAGFTNVINVAGGTLAWLEGGLPITRGRKTVSLERQVRIAAGSLVLVGLALSFLHPACLILSAFVGAGLVFSGVTDTCGMGLLLARMPWNQVHAPTAQCSTKPLAAS